MLETFFIDLLIMLRYLLSKKSHTQMIIAVDGFFAMVIGF